ncbi:HAD family hydrolase [Streptomyces sp. NPDC014995]|uniref:HAD family hydrolase n=1 Tax=Streptomyces sp. NPDC014995 TaxID=3364936 RepID=UPI0036F8C7A7
MDVDLDDVDDVEYARELLAGGVGGPGVACVLFDFDGPLCRLFPLGSSMRVADALRRCVESHGALDVLSGRERTDKDPHVVLHAVHRARRERDLGDLPELLEELVTRGELDAARIAWPTPRADDLVRWLAGRGTRLAVVTNNAPRAADHYLRAHGLRQYFAAVHGRTADPGLMKPHPDVLDRALRDLDLSPGDAVMIGDTPTDVEAAERAGVRFIGYGRNAGKRARLRDAGAKVVLGSYAKLLGAAGQDGAGGRGGDRV